MKDEYLYVCVHLVEASGKRTTWERIPLDRVQAWMDENPDAQEYHHTVQRFKNPSKTESEPHWCDFYIDLDSENLEASLSDARLLVDYFIIGFGVESRVFFSGSKGFHIEVDGEVFGAEPHQDLTRCWAHVMEFIKKKLELKTVCDQTYKYPKQWRIVNTPNPKSVERLGCLLYKVPLSLPELNLSLEQIIELARKPRDWFEYNESEPHQDLGRLYQQAKAEYTKRQEYATDIGKEPADFGDQVPPCVQYFLDNGLALLGTKNKADMALAGYCKDSGMSLAQALYFMGAWAKGIPDSLTHIHSEKARIIQSNAVTRAVYADGRYHFSCGSIKATGLEVDCSSCIIELGALIEVGLWEYSKVEYSGMRIAVEADAIGKHRDELQIPEVIKGVCIYDPEGKFCQGCSMSDYFNADTKRCERVLRFDARNVQTLELADVKFGTYLRNRINGLFNIKDRCRNFSYEVEPRNAQVVFLASRVSPEFKVEDKVMRIRAIYLGHSLDLNKSYRFTGYVHPHPRSLAATFVIDKAEPLQSSLSTFSLCNQELNELKVFQQGTLSVRDKVAEIHAAFTDSFIYVFGRNELLLAVDMVYHSVRWINFQKQRMKGWLDALAVGDTMQGKSDIAEKLMGYYNLGTMAVGETTSRTGLLYTIQIVKGEEAWVSFGLLPRANGHLVIVDEIHGMNPLDFREFTRVRSKGVVDVKRAAWGVAPAETRLISIANAKVGESLGSYQYPVEAITHIPCFKDLSDVSRFDYVVGVRAGEVDDDEVNRDVWELGEINHPYTPELCKNLILWIWTRTLEQIVVARDTEKHILHLAKVMSKEYVPDIPLVQGANVRFKLLRLAAAFAGRTYSTVDGEHLLVKPEHVDAAYDMLNQLYMSPELDYWGFSDERAKGKYTDEEIEKIREDFKARFSEWERISRWFLQTDTFNTSLVRTSTSYNSDSARELLGFLENRKFIGQTARGKYRKTPTGREFLQSLLPKSTRQYIPAAEIQEELTLEAELPTKEDDF